MKRDLLIVLIIIGVIIGLFKLLSRPPEFGFDPQKPIDLTFFWGNGCPHCEKVKKYISDNQIDKKLNIDSKEVYYDKKNQQSLIDAIDQCSEITDKKSIIVPVGVAGGKCFVGDQPIIDWLKTKTAQL